MFCLWVNGLPVIAGILGVGIESAIPVVGLCFSGCGLVAASLAFGQPWLFDRVPAGVAHAVALIVGALGLAVLATATRAGWLMPAFLALAVSWSMMGTVPYAAATAGARPGQGAATLRRFGFSTVAPQLVTTVGLAALTGRWGLSGARVMLLGAVELGLAGILTIFWRDWITVPKQDW